MELVKSLGIPLEPAVLKEFVAQFLLASIRRVAVEKTINQWWQVQGLGMLRLYLGQVARIHIWDPRLKYLDASTIHTHSWRFRSYIVAGTLWNHRYDEGLQRPGVAHGVYHRATIHAGITSDLKLEEQQLVYLAPRPRETYLEGQSYTQEAAEVHYTDFAPGTVTIVERKHDGPDGRANVYWKYGENWVHAKPRPATSDEVLMVLRGSINRWFS